MTSVAAVAPWRPRHSAAAALDCCMDAVAPAPPRPLSTAATCCHSQHESGGMNLAAQPLHGIFFPVSLQLYGQHGLRDDMLAASQPVRVVEGPHKTLRSPPWSQTPLALSCMCAAKMAPVPSAFVRMSACPVLPAVRPLHISLSCNSEVDIGVHTQHSADKHLPWTSSRCLPEVIGIRRSPRRERGGGGLGAVPQAALAQQRRGACGAGDGEAQRRLGPFARMPAHQRTSRGGQHGDGARHHLEQLLLHLRRHPPSHACHAF